MRILVDADACPVKPQILEAALRHQRPVVLVASTAHVMLESPGVEVVRVEESPQAADIALANLARAGDVVITDDYGVACMVLGRKAIPLSSRGRIYDDSNIDALMAGRHLASRARRAGSRSKGPPPFKSEDVKRFREALESILSK